MHFALGYLEAGSRNGSELQASMVCAGIFSSVWIVWRVWRIHLQGRRGSHLCCFDRIGTVCMKLVGVSGGTLVYERQE